MKTLRKLFFNCVYLVALVDNWIYQRWLAGLVLWVVVMGQINQLIVQHGIKRWLDPDPSVWLTMGVLIPLTLSIYHWAIATRTWFWRQLVGQALKERGIDPARLDDKTPLD